AQSYQSLQNDCKRNDGAEHDRDDQWTAAHQNVDERRHETASLTCVAPATRGLAAFPRCECECAMTLRKTSQTVHPKLGGNWSRALPHARFLRFARRGRTSARRGGPRRNPGRRSVLRVGMKSAGWEERWRNAELRGGVGPSRGPAASRPGAASGTPPPRASG